MRCILLFFSVLTIGFGQVPPSITKITNGAIPEMNQLGTHLSPRSIATIWGANLSKTAASGKPPWQNNLGGVEVHVIVNGPYTPCATNPPAGLACEFTTDLLYVSPTQINFVVPEFPDYGQTEFGVRVAIVRDGKRFDFDCNASSCAGTFYILSNGGNFATFKQA
jgi:uncharacterized protein (TIGR03437 family)